MSIPPARQLFRGKSSSSSLSNEGKKKPLKQFTAGGIKSHNRNSSYGQLNKLNKLTRISSVESVEEGVDLRPIMNRSKSSDGVVLKRNRSKTKLVGLAPLTRTISSQSYKGKNAKGSKSQPALDHTGTDSEEEVEEFSDDETETKQTGAAINNGASIEEAQQAPHQREQQEIDNSMPKYFGNILSQSTGMERAIVPSNSASRSLLNAVGRQPHQDYPGLSRLPSKTSFDQIPEMQVESNYNIGTRVPRSMNREEPNESLASFQSSSNLIFQPSSTNIARHYYQQSNPQYQMTSLHRSNTHLDSRGSSASLATDFTKNFREFLNKTPESETRTQQKLWLQRESSILDLTQSSKTYDLNNAQFRTEFEKFSREYLNVRRHTNPVAGSLKRLETLGEGFMKNNEKNQDLSSFEKFSPGAVDKIRQNHVELNKIWETGWKSYNTSSTSINNLTQMNQQRRLAAQQQAMIAQQQQQQQQHMQQRPKPQHRTSSHITLSSSQAPMTRAVANNSGASLA